MVLTKETTGFYYSYNSEGNEFAGVFPAIRNPRRQSEYLLPSMATFKKPPEIKQNETVIWNGNDWIIEPDFRGELQVDIETKEISKIEYIGEIKPGFQRVSKEIAEDIQNSPQKYKKVKGLLMDISETEEYKEFLHHQEISARKSKIEKELLKLDTKRVRAMCEPSIKDDTTGETWLDFYNKQAQTLRNELKKL